jgi:uncharacterized protein
LKTLIFLLVGICFFACNTNNKTDQQQIKNLEIVFDSLKAKQLGADEYGMKQYVMAFLKLGPNRTLDSVKAAELQMAHLKNIIRMADEGKLVLAGPFLDNNEVRGIYIFDVPTIEEAKELTKTDPAIKAGSLVMELRPWYGSAALLEVNKLSKIISKKSIVAD